MKSNLKIGFITLLLILLSTILFCGGGTQTIGCQGGGTQTIGVLVDEKSNAVNGATVELFIADSQKIYESTTTDKSGLYLFDSLPAGMYTIFGKSLDGKVVFITPFQRDTGKLDLGTDTVRTPGCIEGCVTYPLIDSTGKDVVVYIPGTSFLSTTKNGSFTMSGVPKGVYTLKFYREHCFLKSIENVSVKPGSITKLESCVSLEIDTTETPPAPKVLTITQNDIRGTLTLSWRSVPVSDVAGYVIYREASGTLQKIARVADTFFIDTVFNPLTDTIAKVFSYQVKAIDNGNNLSETFSDRLVISAFPPSFYRCQFLWDIRSADGRDTITNADSAVITINFKNRKRIPKSFSWRVDSIQNEIVNHSALSEPNTDDSSYSGIDSFHYRWNSPGTKTVYVKSIDNQGDSWLDSVKLAILDSLTSHPVQSWISAPPMSVKRKFATATVLDSAVYVIGGCVIKSDGVRGPMPYGISSVEKFNLISHTWSKSLDFPAKIYYAASTALNGKIYVFGGAGSSGIYSYKPGDAAWVKCGTLPYALSGMSICNYQNRVLLIGGMNDLTEDMNVILSYDTLTKDVQILDTLDVPSGSRECHSSFIFEDNVYIVGGGDGVDGHANILVYNINSKMVVNSFNLSHSRVNFASWLQGNNLFVAGGMTSFMDGAEICSDAEFVDLSSTDHIWNSIESLPVRVLGAAAVNAGDGLFMFGGTKSNKPTLLGQELDNTFIFYP